MATLIAPYGGDLVNLVAGAEERTEIVARAASLPSVQLSMRSLCDLELLATGALSPLDRFMGERDYTAVLSEMRLANGMVFPIPITLPVPSASGIRADQEVVLRGPTNDLLAVLRVEEVFPRSPVEAREICGTTDPRHPLVAELRVWGSSTFRVLSGSSTCQRTTISRISAGLP